jgi:hypothetical protein
MRVIGGGRRGESESSQSSRSSRRSGIDYAAWVTKAVAAARLEVSTKTIEQWDKDGTLPGTLYKRPTGGPRLRVYDPARVATLVAERRLGRPVTVLGPDSGGEVGVGSGAGLEPVALMVPDVDTRAAAALGAVLEALAALVAKSAKPVSESSQSAQTLVLTLEQAAAVSGWSVGFLRRARAAGKLPAERDRWRGADGRWHRGWKVRRTDLEAL